VAAPPPPGVARFVLAGLSRLTVRVAKLLASEPGADVVVLAGVGDGPELRALLPAGTAVVVSGEDPQAALASVVTAGTRAILALDDDDRANLRVALASDAVAPDVPLVIRAFDPVLAARLERGSNLRRAYSVSGLAAPAFVAAALADRAVHTLRLGEGEVPLLRLSVAPGSPLAGLTQDEAARRHQVRICARSRGGDVWVPEGTGSEPLAVGEEALVGGELHAVLRLAVAAADLPRPRRSAVRLADLELRRAPGSTPTLVPWVAGALGLVLLANVVVFGVALGLGPIDAIYFAVTTAFGDPGLAESDAWLKAFGVSSMIAGGAMIGVLFSQLASVATANRLDARMGRRARRLAGHAIVVGLGTVGYRVERLLFELGVPTVVIERTANSRFADAVADRTPVLVGDVRLLENLERAGAGRAAMLFGCTDDDLTNIGACLQARRLNPRIRTVARVFDDVLAERGRTAFDLDAAISASNVAAAAFAGAATDAFARRTFRLGSDEWLAMRWEPAGGLDAERLSRLREAGANVVAWSGPDGVVRSGDLGDGLAPGNVAVLTGPARVVESLARGG
jgi:Trk K+ transport system NAD-binding subunit